MILSAIPPTDLDLKYRSVKALLRNAIGAYTSVAGKSS